MTSSLSVTWFNPIGRLIRVVVCAASLLWLTFPASAAPAALLSVNGTTGTINPADPCPNPRDSAIYRTVQKAVNCALAGDVIAVAAGTYNENVAINKAISLLGANAGIDGRGSRGAESIVNGGATSAPIGISARVHGRRVQTVGGSNGLGAAVDRWRGEQCPLIDNDHRQHDWPGHHQRLPLPCPS
jgi:nitrous oxidase accessory protein NosD